MVLDPAGPTIGHPPTPLRAFELGPAGIRMLDQRALPDEECWLELSDVESVARAIETLAVRGAPAIGGVAAAALVLSARAHGHNASPERFERAILRDAARLARTRPTAVNLFTALAHMQDALRAGRRRQEPVTSLRERLEQAAVDWIREDEQACARMGELGAACFASGDRVITICHTGALATCGQGTALGVLKSARAQGTELSVFALETRPLLQGARLTAWECLREGIPVTLLTDSMAAFALERQGITRAIVGADRIARNGDVANKIGTLGLARLCAAAGVPFYVAAPTSTIDTRLDSGLAIPIEERGADEVRKARGATLAPDDVAVWNPAFDVTPHSLIAGIITEAGIWRPPGPPPGAAAAQPGRG